MTLAAIRILLAMIAGAFTMVPAASQNPDATPTYGDEHIISPMDEALEIRIQAGGPIVADEFLPTPCRGHIASAPDFDLDYQASGIALHIYVESDSDTTLAVTAPDGQWHCADDDNGLNPALAFDAPGSGIYRIWVGTYRDSGAERATLFISETPPGTD